jgi:hypothetical protein
VHAGALRVGGENSDPLCKFSGCLTPKMKATLRLYKGKRLSVPVTGLGVAQRVGRGIAILFHDRGTRRG